MSISSKRVEELFESSLCDSGEAVEGITAIFKLNVEGKEVEIAEMLEKMPYVVVN